MQQLIKLINPKRIFRTKKSKDRFTVSRSEQSSFGSSSTSSSDDAQMKTPTSVLPDTVRSDPSDLLQAFKLMDKDKDGLIAKAEVAAVLSRLGAERISQEEVAWMLKEVEEEGEGGGCVRLEALASRLGSVCEAAGEEELRETFEYFDTDGDGRITAEELLRVFKEGIGDEACTLEDCQRMISVVDKTGHGFVYFPDFARMMLLQR